jgi:hypothetical protein
MRPVRAALLLALVATAPVPAQAVDQGTLVIETADGMRHQFDVEIVTTPQEMAIGLMFRQQMAPDAGMLFVYPSARETSFWMKNTYLPLDMLFAGDDGIIHHIAERTVPLSTTPVPSHGATRAVLELNGGTSDRLGIAAGDRLVWPEGLP